MASIWFKVRGLSGSWRFVGFGFLAVMALAPVVDINYISDIFYPGQ
jgi:hypothetical protein